MLRRDARVMFNLDKPDTSTAPEDEQELKSLVKADPETITDVDISENTPKVLTFTKRPWSEWIFGTIFIGLPILIFLLTPV